MTRIFGFVFALLLLSPGLTLAQDLTLRDVIELRRSGLGDDLLIAVIEADGGPLNLTYADIQDLKSDGFSERLIAAMVRTGARSGQAQGSAPVVHVQQDVTNVVVPAVVVVDPRVVAAPRYDRDDVRHQPGDFDRRDGHRRDNRHRPAQPPPASWVTRQEDGKNVTSSGDLRKGVPPAAWVTQREPEVEPRHHDKPRPDDKPRPKS